MQVLDREGEATKLSLYCFDENGQRQEISFCNCCKKFTTNSIYTFGICSKCQEEIKSLQGISISVLNWENPDRLTKCLQAIRDQDYQGKVQIIVEDDGSTSDIKSICDKFHAEFYSNPADVNVGRMVNHAMAMAEYENLLFLNQDLVLNKNFLSLLSTKLGPNKLIAGDIFEENGGYHHATRFRKDYGPENRTPSFFDGGGIAITKDNCPLFDTTQKNSLYVHTNPRWLERCQHMGLQFEYHPDLIIIHQTHERRGP